MRSVLCASPFDLDLGVQQRPPEALAGGLMLSLDLKQAYDRLPRRHLHSGLHYCGCPPELSTVLLQWLHEAQYHVHHRGLENKLTTV